VFGDLNNEMSRGDLIEYEIGLEIDLIRKFIKRFILECGL